MSDLDIEKTRAELTDRKATLAARIEEIDDALESPGDDDFEEMATESADDERLEATGNSAAQEIAQIDRALRRIDGGKYGTCETCGCDIPRARLETLPYATQCVQCASAATG